MDIGRVGYTIFWIVSAGAESLLMEAQKMKLKKMWEQRMLRKKRECGRREVFMEKVGETPLQLSEEVVSPQVVLNMEVEEEVVVLRFVDGSGNDITGKARDSALEVKRKEERHLRIKAALEAKKAPKTPEVVRGKSPLR